MPIKPRSERGNKWLRYALAALLLAVVVGGSAFAITRFLDDGDDNDPPVVAATGETPTPDQSAATEVPAGEEEQPTQEPAPTEQADDSSTEDEAGDVPTQIPTATEEPEQEAEAAAPESASNTDLSAASLLPAAADLDGAFTIFEEGTRTKAEVGVQLGENGEDLLESWSWRENEYRDFVRDNSAELPNETAFLSVSVHRYASQGGAAESLNFLTDVAIGFYEGLEEISIESIGDEARALAGPSDGANLYILYVRDGNYVIRLGGSSATGDPAPFVNAVATQLVAA